mgnify:CR=1 FL=1
MINILPHIAECNATLCFNWPGQEEHLTSRYNEALGCDTIPLVWKDYDCNNQLVYSVQPIYTRQPYLLALNTSWHWSSLEHHQH